MFGRMRAALGIDKGIDILDHIEAMTPDNQLVAEEAIRNVEREAMVCHLERIYPSCLN
jgi:hypothetical protein